MILILTPPFDLGGLQGRVPEQLPDPGLDAVEAAENLHRALDAGGLPARHGLQLGEHLVKAVPQIAQHVIRIGRESVPGI